MPNTTKTRKVTYLGRKAEVWEVREGGPTSERHVYQRWRRHEGLGPVSRRFLRFCIGLLILSVALVLVSVVGLVEIYTS
jgi:hypothetical protein